MPSGRGSLRRVLVLCLAVLLAASPALAAEHEGGAAPKPPAGPVFVKLSPIVLPVIEANAVTRQVGILVTLELAEGQSLQTIEPKRRQLRDAFITELYRIYGWRSTADHVVNEALIKASLARAADRVLGAGVVRAVLIGQLLEQER
jgi:flagellar basal body-associated protein FliL